MIYPYKNIYPYIHKSVFVAPSADIIGDVNIDEDSSIWYGVVIRGDVHSIKIGKRVSVQDLSMIHVTHYKKEDKSDGSKTVIQDDVTIGHHVMIHGCVVEYASLIGMGSIILDDVVIGHESIVGAGSLITKGKKFPPRSLILGNPAKVVRQLNENEINSLYQSSKNYVNFKNSYML